MGGHFPATALPFVNWYCVVAVKIAPECSPSGTFGRWAELRYVNSSLLHCIMLTIGGSAAFRYINAGNLHCIMNPLWHVALWELSS
jgi:hypothetical protein